MPCRPIYMARVAAIGVKFAKRIRTAVDSSDDKCAEEHQDETRRDHQRGFVVVDEERRHHDQKSGERADRKVDGAEQQRDGLPERNESQGGGQRQDIVDD